MQVRQFSLKTLAGK